MQMVSDVVRGLVARNLLPQEIAADIQLKGNMVLSPHREDWLTVWSALCKETGGLDEGIMGRTKGRPRWTRLIDLCSDTTAPALALGGGELDFEDQNDPGLEKLNPSTF